MEHDRIFEKNLYKIVSSVATKVLPNENGCGQRTERQFFDTTFIIWRRALLTGIAKN